MVYLAGLIGFLLIGLDFLLLWKIAEINLGRKLFHKNKYSYKELQERYTRKK